MRVASILAVTLVMPFLMGFTQVEKSVKNPEYLRVTQNPKVMKALDLLDGTIGEWAKKAILGDNLSKRPMRVVFKNLGEISPAYTNFDALGWRDGQGQLYIYINEKHSTAPIEALASLLAHESMHQDGYNSMAEETFAWGYEADVWVQMKKINPELETIGSNVYPLVDRMNTLEKAFKAGNYTTKYIRQLVVTNPGYTGLPAYSPGFEDENIKPAVLKKPKYSNSSLESFSTVE